MLLSVSGLSKSFGDNLLFENIGFDIESDDIVGLIGGNGCGKTTLFRIISGEELPDSGGVVRKSGVTVGVLNQHACQGSQKTAYHEALSVFDELLKLEDELSEVILRLETDQSDELIERHHVLREQFEAMDGLTFRAKTKSALMGLGFSEDELALTIPSLSGGQRSKIELCKLLLSAPDVILLDEPTNHLDIDAIEWLDGYIKTCKKAVIIISHDRFFLDRVANRIFEMENHKLYCCDGNYTKYCIVKEERKLTIQRNYDNTMREVGRIERIIEQQRRWNREKNIKTAESKQKQIDRLLRDLEIPDSEREGMSLSFSAAVRSGDEVLNAENLSMSFDGRTLYRNVSLDILRGERVFIIGPNGCGKTTLLKQLLDKMQTRYGVGVSVGYFDQHQRDLDLNKTIFQQLRDDYPTTGDTALRSALALFLFKGEEVFEKIETLSGGERARVALCRLMLKHNNLLLLDEPTNHLDLESREVLEEALDGFDGTLVCVSHDRYLINRLASKLVYFENGTVKILDGNYDKYLEVREVQTAPKNEKTVSQNKNEYLRKKEEASRLRKLKTAFSKCEQEIEATEQALEEVNAQLSSDEVVADYEKVAELSQKADELNTKLEELMLLWEQLGAELEALE
ncbi:MAG: ABC-F family ATP-binding cassette domain-containing protein [Clostridia bacterium]|nr:ABC-F family ATP-binding cassette domain-containing protein [Clostridia bacterium]